MYVRREERGVKKYPRGGKKVEDERKWAEEKQEALKNNQEEEKKVEEGRKWAEEKKEEDRR